MTDLTDEELREQFDSLDTNGNGTLCSGEMEQLVQMMGLSPTKDVLQSFMTNFDKDGDNTVTFEEFCAFTKSPNGSRDEDKKQMEEAFKHFDKNGDGSIDKEELKGLLELFEGETVDEFLEKFDKNADGKINIEELLAVITAT